MERPIMDRNIFNSLFKFADNVIKRYDGKMIQVRVYRKKKNTQTQGTIRLFIIYIFIRMRNRIRLFYFIVNVF